MTEQPDRRVRKTKKAIHRALLDLMETRDLSSITVKELTERADINRKTFYNHYSDIYSVLSDIEDSCVDLFINSVREIDVQEYIDNPKLFFQKVVTELGNREEFLLLLSRGEGYSHLTEKLIRREKELLREIFGEETLDETLLDYFLNYNAAGANAVIRLWLLSERDVPIERLAEFFNVLFSASDVRRYIRAAMSKEQ